MEIFSKLRLSFFNCQLGALTSSSHEGKRYGGMGRAGVRDNSDLNPGVGERGKIRNLADRSQHPAGVMMALLVASPLIIIVFFDPSELL